MEPDGPSPKEEAGSSPWARLRCPVTVANVSVLCALLCVLFPKIANSAFFVYRLVFGTLYPAYASYKAVRSRDVREYVKWMMYWIVFALFTCGETITDVFLSFWFPFYYEIKIGFVLWLLSPATKGSSILYRKFVHPMLTNREQEIDEYIAKAKEQGYHTVLHLGSKGVNYATNVIMQTAIKSVEVAYKGGGGLVNQLRKSYSLSDLTDGEGEPVRDVNRNGKDVDGLEYRGNRRPDRVDGSRSSNRARGYSPRRSASGSARMEMYFPEVDLDVRQRRGSSRSREASVPLSHIRSSEDVSSGYTSGDHFYEDATQMDVDQASEDPGSLPAGEGPLLRTASVGSTRPTRTKGSTSSRANAASSASTAAKKATQGENYVDGSSSEEEDLWDDPLDHVSPPLDRTLFVNDLNTFPAQQPKFTVELISSSAEVSHTPSTGIDVVNANISSIFTDNQPNADGREVIKLVPVDIQSEMSEQSCSKINHALNDVPEVMNTDIQKDYSLVAPEDIKYDLSSPSECLLSGEKSSESVSNYSPELVPEENNVVSEFINSPAVSTEKSVGPEIPCVSQASISEANMPASGSIMADNDEPTPVVTEGLGSKLDSEEPVSTTVCCMPSASLEPTLPSAGIESVVIEHTQSQELEGVTKVAPVSVTSVVVEQTELQVLEDASKVLASLAKESHAAGSRGGKYNKRAAPEPPQNIDQLIGTSAEADVLCLDAVHARLVLKRGVVRSLPDVGVISSEDSPRSEVFMAVNAPHGSSHSPSSHSNLLPKHDDVDARDVSKGQSAKGNVGAGFPRFLNIPGRPHFGSLTSLFPFWHGGSSAESSPAAIRKKIGESVVANGEKKSSCNIECRDTTGGSRPHEKVIYEKKLNDQLKAGSNSKSNPAERRKDEEKKNFPVRQLSHSPSRSRNNHRS